MNREDLFYKNGKAKKSLCVCLSREKRAELKRIHGYDIIQCAGNVCPYYSVECGRENIKRFEEAKRNRFKFRLDTPAVKERILRVDIVDNDMFIEERLQGTFYLINPDEEKVQKLKSLIENRFETGALEQYTEVIDYINANFETLDIETFEIAW